MAFEGVTKLFNAMKLLDDTKILNIILSDKDLQAFIIDLNTDKQLFKKGVDSLGVTLGQYAGTTIEGVEGKFLGKKEKGQPFAFITLKDTGDFYKTWEFKVNNGGFILTADPKKEDGNLFDDFGEKVVGLTKDHLQIVIDIIREKIITEIWKQIRNAA